MKLSMNILRSHTAGENNKINTTIVKMINTSEAINAFFTKCCIFGRV